MPKSCCVVNCTANKKKNPELKFTVIPCEGEKRESWLKAINRATVNRDGSINNDKLWSPKTGYSYVCSQHFISGAHVKDKTHPDYVPSIFPSARKDEPDRKSTGKLDRYNRAKKRTQPEVCTDEIPKARKKLKLDAQILFPDDCGKQEDTQESRHGDEIENSLCSKEYLYTATPLPMKQPVATSEREAFFYEIDNLRRERDEALEEIRQLQSKLNSTSVSVAAIEGNDDVCFTLTGISWDTFEKLFHFLDTYKESKSSLKASLPSKEQLLLTLVKLKHGISFDFLAIIKGIPKSSAIDYFWKWTNLINVKAGFLIRWEDRETISKTNPPQFKGVFPRLTCIIDCFEIFTEAPKNLHARAQCYSSYKKHCTVKYLISCSPLGAVNFVSRGYGGRASDVKIVRDSDFISYKYHMPGDQILADRGFTLHEDFAVSCGAELITPAFTKGKRQLSAKEVETSRKISSVRIHIERVIGLMKNRFNILKGPLPVRCVQSLKDESMSSVYASCDKIVRVCAILINLEESIVC